MDDVLEAVRAGELSISEAKAELVGYVTNDAGRFDAVRERRRGIPEVIFAAGKPPEDVAGLATSALESTDRAILTRVDDQQLTELERTLQDIPTSTWSFDQDSETLVIHGEGFSQPSIPASVGVVTAGTVDAGPAGEAAMILSELGVDVERIEDVGVAHLKRMTDQLDRLRAQDVLIVAAGREGSLPTVVAGLVDVPVIGLPISSGYGHGGDGEAAMIGMLQSCTVLSVVNIDAGYVAGAQAGLIARQIADERSN